MTCKGFAVLLIGTCLLSTVAATDTCVVPPDHHPWGCFHVGSWKQVRVLNENLDDDGIVVSTSSTETRTTLTAIDEQSYTLRVESTVEVAGKRFLAEPKTVRMSFNGEDVRESVTLRKIGSGSVNVNGETIPSQISEITVNGGDIKRVTTIYYSDQVCPYVLKREMTSTDANGNSTSYASQVEVLAVAMPYRVLSEVKTASFVLTVNQRLKGKTVTVEVLSFDVPGGVVAHTLKEIDEMGRVVRRSTLELVDYGVSETPSRRGLLPRRRTFKRSG